MDKSIDVHSALLLTKYQCVLSFFLAGKGFSKKNNEAYDTVSITINYCTDSLGRGSLLFIWFSKGFDICHRAHSITGTVAELLKALNLAVVPRSRFCKQNERQLHGNRIM